MFRWKTYAMMSVLTIAFFFGVSSPVSADWPASPPCGSYDGGKTLESNSVLLSQGESWWFDFGAMKNERWAGYLVSRSLENHGLDGGIIEWAIYNGDAGTLVQAGFVSNSVSNAFSGNGFIANGLLPNTSTFGYDRVCFLMHNHTGSESVQVTWEFVALR